MLDIPIVHGIAGNSFTTLSFGSFCKGARSFKCYEYYKGCDCQQDLTRPQGWQHHLEYQHSRKILKEAGLREDHFVAPKIKIRLFYREIDKNWINHLVAVDNVLHFQMAPNRPFIKPIYTANIILNPVV